MHDLGYCGEKSRMLVMGNTDALVVAPLGFDQVLPVYGRRFSADCDFSTGVLYGG